MYKSPENARHDWKSLRHWRVQIFIITWLAYAAFYFTRKAFSVAKLGIAEDPSFMLDKAAMANLDALYLAAYALGQFAWGVFADRYGTRVVVLGGLVVSAWPRWPWAPSRRYRSSPAAW